MTDIGPRGVTPSAGAPGPDRLGPAWWARMGWRRWLGVVVVAAVLVLAAAWSAIDPQYHVLAAGTVRETSEGMPVGPTATVWLPYGRLRIAATAPRRALPHQVAEDEVGGDVRPPDGGRFVGVRWSVPGDQQNLEPVKLLPYTPPPTRIELTTGGHRYLINAAALDGGACGSEVDCVADYAVDRVWVALPGPADDLRISVRFDGVVQTVDPATGRVRGGRAATLAGATTHRPGCGTPSWTPGRRGVHATCTLTWVRSGYVPGVGWAPPGHTFVAVSVGTQAPYRVLVRTGAGSAVAYVSPEVTSTRSTLTGGRLTRAQPYTQDGDLGRPVPFDYYGNDAVFTVPTGQAHNRLAIRTTWGLDPSAPAADTATTTTATWTVTL